MSRCIAIVQARLGSSRLPLKSLVCLGNLPIIDWVCRRAAQSNRLNGLVVATPDTRLDLPLGRHLARRHVPLFTGPEDDVLLRMDLAARAFEADIVVRVCADNPLISSEAIDALLEFYGHQSCDYAWNHMPRENLWPDGFGAEVVSARVLHRINELAQTPAQREHCFNYIWDNRDKFRMATFDPAQDWLRRPDVKLDIDTAEDYARLAELQITPRSSQQEIIRAWDWAQQDAHGFLREKPGL